MTEEKKNTTLNELNWMIECTKRDLVNTLKEAQAAAQRFTNIDPTDTMADWHLDDLYDSIERRRRLAKELKAKIASLEQAAAIVKSYND